MLTSSSPARQASTCDHSPTRSASWTGTGACLGRRAAPERRVLPRQRNSTAELSEASRVASALIPPSALLHHVPAIAVNSRGFERVAHGRGLEPGDYERWPAASLSAEWVRLLNLRGDLIGMGTPGSEPGLAPRYRADKTSFRLAFSNSMAACGSETDQFWAVRGGTEPWRLRKTARAESSTRIDARLRYRSWEVQVALLSERINYFTEHFMVHS